MRTRLAAAFEAMRSANACECSVPFAPTQPTHEVALHPPMRESPQSISDQTPHLGSCDSVLNSWGPGAGPASAPAKRTGRYLWRTKERCERRSR